MDNLGKCVQCKRRKAKVKFSTEPVFAITHGYGVKHLCRQCYVKLIEAELKQINKNLKEQKKMISEDALKER